MIELYFSANVFLVCRRGFSRLRYRGGSPAKLNQLHFILLFIIQLNSLFSFLHLVFNGVRLLACLVNKSDIACLKEHSKPTSETPPTTFMVLDEAIIVQMLKPATDKRFKSFSDYAHQIFAPYMLS